MARIQIESGPEVPRFRLDSGVSWTRVLSLSLRIAHPSRLAKSLLQLQEIMSFQREKVGLTAEANTAKVIREIPRCPMVGTGNRGLYVCVSSSFLSSFDSILRFLLKN